MDHVPRGSDSAGGLGWLVHTRVHFQWSVFRDELQHVDWRRIVFGIAMVGFCYWLRAARWAVLVKPQKKVTSFSLLGSQVIGFTAVALFGRLADLVRPYLVAKRTSLPITSQIAVYTVERMFDLGAMAMIFSGAFLLAPDRATLPHHEALQHAALGAWRLPWRSPFLPSACALPVGRLPVWRKRAWARFRPLSVIQSGPRFAPFATVSIPLPPGVISSARWAFRC